MKRFFFSCAAALVLAGVPAALNAQERPLCDDNGPTQCSDDRLEIDSPGEESYIRFTVSGAGPTVFAALLRVYVSNGSSDGPGVYGTTNSWSETGITWNNRPAPTTGAIDNIGSVSRDVWVEYDVTAYVTGNGTYSFVFQPDSSNGVRFESREGDPPPELFLSFVPLATPTPTVTPSPTNTPGPTSTPDPSVSVFVGAGDIGQCGGDAEETALLLDNISGTVYTVGDNAYPNGSLADYNNCYDP